MGRSDITVDLPPIGEVVTGFKMCKRVQDYSHSHVDTVLVQLEIPADARRCSGARPPECRAEFAKVISIAGGLSVAYSRFFRMPGVRQEYMLGETVRADAWGLVADDPSAGGIYFYLDQATAERS